MKEKILHMCSQQREEIHFIGELNRRVRTQRSSLFISNLTASWCTFLMVSRTRGDWCGDAFQMHHQKSARSTSADVAIVM